MELVNKSSMRQLVWSTDHVEGISHECEGMNAQACEEGQLL